ncbi:response regulator [Oceanimonas sp. CHS3-5]|uniref:response regulator n=1 Tax=Oceanimonas sp. CHS3-5 TaxID=3068186 RepID=UPI00273F847E|nr:response regulator [Oceanimonas sp. CHS3-5]MDP5292410.1 response regulator [Oceanimonas sp. CHS3-5]
MNEESSQPVFVAAGSSDTREMVTGILENDHIDVEVPNKDQSLIKAFDASHARVLIFAFKQVEQSLKLAELFRAKSRRFQDENCRLVLLCDKLEAKQAYQLCRQGKFNNYVVFWPLSFDPFRLSMAIYQEFYELEQQRAAQGRQDKLDGQQLVVSELEAILSRQLDGGEDLTGSLRTLLNLAAGTEAQTPEHDMPSPNRLYEQIKQLDSSVRNFESLSSSSLRDLRQALSKVSHHNGTILVVEEDPAYRKMMTSILKSHDFHILTADSTAAAISLLEQHMPDLVLMEILMPGLSGAEAVRLLKEVEPMKEVPVIIISSQSQKSVIVECVQLGATAFVAKPFSQKLLMDKVHGALGLPGLVPA